MRNRRIIYVDADVYEWIDEYVRKNKQFFGTKMSKKNVVKEAVKALEENGRKKKLF